MTCCCSLVLLLAVCCRLLLFRCGSWEEDATDPFCRSHLDRFSAAVACGWPVFELPLFGGGASTAPPPASVAAYCSRAAPSSDDAANTRCRPPRPPRRLLMAVRVTPSFPAVAASPLQSDYKKSLGRIFGAATPPGALVSWYCTFAQGKVIRFSIASCDLQSKGLRTAFQMQKK